MNKLNLSIAFLIALLLVISAAIVYGGKTVPTGEVKITEEVNQTEITPDTPNLSSMTGEQVQRQVISSGGNSSSSANYVVSGTMTQTAIGDAGSTNYNANQGFWQRAASPSDECTPPGDANSSGEVDIDDVVFLIAYIFSGGQAPDPLCCGDANGSGAIDIDDVVYLIAYIFSGGPPPVPVPC